MSDVPPPGTPVDLYLVEDRRNLGQRVLARVRGRIPNEPPDVSIESSQWWFMLGWVMRSCIFISDDEEQVIDTFSATTGVTVLKPQANREH